MNFQLPKKHRCDVRTVTEDHSKSRTTDSSNKFLFMTTVSSRQEEFVGTTTAVHSFLLSSISFFDYDRACKVKLRLTYYSVLWTPFNPTSSNLGASIFTYRFIRVKVNSLPMSINAIKLQSPILTSL